MDQNLLILSERIISSTPQSTTIRRWIKGKHPRMGVLQIGWSGDWETVVDTTIHGKIHTFFVRDTSDPSAV